MSLQLSPNVTLNNWVKLLHLPQTENESALTTDCLVPGWGATSLDEIGSKVLREVNVTVDPSLNCDTSKSICTKGPRGPYKVSERASNLLMHSEIQLNEECPTN